jgi:DNA-binding MarR family transcriptional regulator
MDRLKKSELAALRAAKQIGDGFTPTLLGLALGHERAKASSRVAPALRSLRERGFVSRHEVKHNLVTYSVTAAGRAALASDPLVRQ